MAMTALVLERAVQSQAPVIVVRVRCFRQQSYGMIF
jgi:hypothetical protein